ncbi:MAG: phosphoribosylformylglycinamidine synthase subunit PurQ [Bacteroidota bacterium]|jgi:phosphoribosylformylglycinamidine synthase
MKFGVITFPGSNCDMDMVHALRDDLGFEVTSLWHKDRDLKGSDVVVLPGGFSYGDYLRSGALARFAPIMDAVVEHAARGGRVFGVCNGFQILCEAGLLPGTLLHNAQRKFVSRNVFIRPVSERAPLTAGLDKDKALQIPIAHGEGNYFVDEAGLALLKANDQILFTYCDESGASQPWSNPNGALENIAGVCNAEHNVFGMMPHPERASSPALGNTDGRAILEGLVAQVLA